MRPAAKLKENIEWDLDRDASESEEGPIGGWDRQSSTKHSFGFPGGW